MTRQHYVVARAPSWLNVLPGTSHSGALPLRLPAPPIVTLTKVTIVASFVLLGGVFWASGMIEARVPSAAVPQSVNVEEIGQTLPGNLPLFEDEYQRHYGVLDTLTE
jgi:hypothetical protein